tara:strand:+ start:434 stop:1039 length:606 start_codon:yes stop_codon:yes gene_type:complete
MSSDLKAFVYGWGILIAFLVIRYLVRKNSEKKQRNYALNLMGLTKTSVNDQKELKGKPQILHFKSNKSVYEFALVSLVNGFGTMNFFHVGIIQGKPFGKKKEVQKKIKGDRDKVVNEISKYKIKIAYKGKEVKAIGTRTDNLSVTKRPAYKVGDLVAITDLSHSMKDKITGVERDETKDYQFQILTKIKPTFNVKKMDFER